MSEKEKREKSLLVQTRKVIANKFKKLNRGRLIREIQLNERYLPITDSINRLIDKKEKVTKEIDRIHEPDNVSMRSSSDVPNTKHETTFMEFETNGNENQSEHANSVNDIKSEKLAHEPFISKNDKPSMPRLFFNAFGDAVTYKDNRRNQAAVLEKTRQESTLVRKGKRTEAIDSHRFIPEAKKYVGNKKRINEMVHVAGKSRKIQFDYDRVGARYDIDTKRKQKRSEKNDLNREFPAKPKPYAGNRKRIVDSIAVASKIKTKAKPRNVAVIRKSEQKAKRSDIHDKLRDLNNPNKRQREIISPEDYDANGNYLGPATKRRKVERKRKPNLVVLSPEDYGIDGSLVGIAKKRRKIEISDERVSKVKENRANELKKEAAKLRRNKRIAAMKKLKHGTCLEKKFIPYAENIVYEYYDNPNELCERLKLLVSSKRAGNSNHDQEINSILEELRERHLIH